MSRQTMKFARGLFGTCTLNKRHYTHVLLVQLQHAALELVEAQQVVEDVQGGRAALLDVLQRIQLLLLRVTSEDGDGGEDDDDDDGDDDGDDGDGGDDGSEVRPTQQLTTRESS